MIKRETPTSSAEQRGCRTRQRLCSGGAKVQDTKNFTPQNTVFDFRHVLNHRRYMRSQPHDAEEPKVYEPSPPPSPERKNDFVEETMEKLEEVNTSDSQEEAATPMIFYGRVPHSVITASYLKNLVRARPLHASTLASFDN